jgi:hypothetical protein
LGCVDYSEMARRLLDFFLDAPLMRTGRPGSLVMSEIAACETCAGRRWFAPTKIIHYYAAGDLRACC